MKAALSHLFLAVVLFAHPPVEAQETPVPTLLLAPRSFASSLSAEATIEAVRQATLAAQVPGRIMALEVDAGDSVRRGQLLARIDPSEASAALAAADARVAAAEADLVNARAEHQRARSLVAKHFLSQSALDAARSRLDAAEAQVRAARASRGQAATVEGYTAISSPLDGLVAVRHIERGEMAQPGRALLTVYDPAAMRAVVDLPQQRLASFDGGPLSARVELPDSGRRLDATAVSVLPAADARTHTVRLRVELPPGSRDLLPGSFARVHFFTGERSRVVLPAAAVLRRGELTAVYVADGEGGFSLRQVRLGRAIGADGEIEVLAGLKGDETVALDPVRAGLQVRGAAAR